MQAPIAARASGYLKRWTSDIGSRVQKGELLAEIETPEIDQQLSQAVAAREQAAASLALARSTLERWEALRKKDVVSQQELDERRSAAAQAQANLAAADANVERLRQLEGFKRVIAPFAGVITRRNVDVGDLIDAGGGSGRALFVLTQTDPLRVYVNVPQSYAQLVKPGQTVTVTQAELRGQQLRGQGRAHRGVDRHEHPHDAGRDRAAQPGRRAAAGRLRAGVAAAAASATLTIPTNALLIRAERHPRSRVVDARAAGAPAAGQDRPQLRPDRRGAGGRRTERPAGAEPAGFAGRRRPGRIVAPDAPAAAERRLPPDGNRPAP